MSQNLTNDPLLTKTYEKLKKIRERKNLSLRANAYLRDSFTAPDGSEKELKFRYYQVQAILHLMSMKRFVLGDDTGLGKTAITIGALCYLWEGNPDLKVIILTTKSAVPQWKEEFEKFSVGINAIISSGTPKKRMEAYQTFEHSTGPTALISGYRSMVADISDLQHLKGFILVTDEATAFKNPATQVHKVCALLSSNAERTWALTATLIKNHLVEGYGIYKVVVPNLFTSKNRFLMEYCIVRFQQIKGNRQVPVIVGHSDEHIRNFKNLIDPYFLGRAKFEVASELPVLTSKNIKVTMTPAQEAKYQEALSGLLLMREGSKEEEEVEVTPLTAITRCQQIVNHLSLIGCEGNSAKLDKLVSLLSEGDLAEEKVIVFTRFKELVNLAVPLLRKKLEGGPPKPTPPNRLGKKPTPSVVRITGDENPEERQKAKKAFLDPNSETRVIFITMAGSDAINLQSAKALIFFDTPWSAGDYLQILGRMIRVGSTHERVYSIHLVAEGTIDQRVLQVLTKKMKLVEAIIGKRIQGEEAQIEKPKHFEIVHELNELFDLLLEDATDHKKT